MAFRYKKGIRVPYKRQGYIYFTMLAVRDLPREKQEKMRRLCMEAAGAQHFDALWDLLTCEDGYVAVSLRHNVSQETLFRLRKRFYEGFPEKL